MKYAIGITAICIVFISQCDFTGANDDFAEQFNAFVIQTAGKFVVGQTKKTQDGQLLLDKAQEMQRWLLQVAEQFVAPDPVFDGHYVCLTMKKKIMDTVNQKILKELLSNGGSVTFGENATKMQLLQQVAQQDPAAKLRFFKLLFSMGARMSAMMEGVGNPELQQHPLRAFLRAFECVGGDNREKNVYHYQIDPIIEHWNVQGVIFSKQKRNRLQSIGNFAFLRSLNENKNELGPKEALLLADYLKSVFLGEFIEDEENADSWIQFHRTSTNPFSESNFKELGLKVEEFDQDPVRYRRIVRQLVVHLKGWAHSDLEENSKKWGPIPLELHELCALGNFGRNLLRRVAGYRLLEEYGQELGLALAENIEPILVFYADFVSKKCQNMMKDKEQREKFIQKEFYFLYDEAFRLDFNIWKEIIRNIDQISREISEMEEQNKKEELGKYISENANYAKVMTMVQTKLEPEKYGPSLTLSLGEDSDTKRHHGKMGKIMEKMHVKEEAYHGKVKDFLETLEIVKQDCEEKGKEFEREIPIKKEQKVINEEKLKKNLEQFFGLIIGEIGRKYGAKKEINEVRNVELTVENAKIFLNEMYKLTKSKVGTKSAESMDFVRILSDLLGSESKGQIKQIQKESYKSEELENLRINGPKMDAKPIIDGQMAKLLYSFASRLEAMVHGEGDSENAEELGRIGTFLETTERIILPEWININFCIAPFHIEIVEMDEKDGKIRGIEIRKEVEYKKEFASEIYQEGYRQLKGLHNYSFSINETLRLLKQLANVKSKRKNSQIVADFIRQIKNEYSVKIGLDRYRSIRDLKERITPCESATLAKNIWAKFVRESAKNGIQSQKYTTNEDMDVQKEIEQIISENCGKLERELIGKPYKVLLLENFVRYDLAVNFTFNPWKDLSDRIDDLLFSWENEIVKSNWNIFATGNEERMVDQLNFYANSKEIAEQISKVEELAPNEPFKLGEKLKRMGDKKMTKMFKEMWKKIEEERIKSERINKQGAEKDTKTRIQNQKENIETKERKIKEKDREIAGLNKKVGHLKKKVENGEEAHQAVKFANAIINGKQGQDAVGNHEILRKIREIQNLRGELDNVESEARKSVQQLEKEHKGIRGKTEANVKPGMVQKWKQKMNNGQNAEKDPVEKERNFREKVKLFMKKTDEYQKKIGNIFERYGIAYLLENSEEIENKIDEDNFKTEFDRIEKVIEQEMEELHPYLDILLKVKLEQERTELEKEYQDLKAVKLLSYGEEKAKIETDLAKTENELKEQYEKLRNLAEGYKQTLENMKSQFENKASEWKGEKKMKRSPRIRDGPMQM